MREEGRQLVHPCLAVFHLVIDEDLRGADQFVEVLQPRAPLFALFLLIVLAQARVVQHLFHLLGETEAGEIGTQAPHEIDEALQGIEGTGIQTPMLQHMVNGLPQGHARGTGLVAHLGEGTLSNTPRWLVDDALAGGIIERIAGQTQVGQPKMRDWALER